MKIIFLSNFYPRTRRDFYLNRSKSGLASAADAHQYALALGLNVVCSDFCIINAPAIFPFPLRYKDISIPSELICENGLSIHNVGFSTLVEYQFYSVYRNLYRQLRNEVQETNDLVYIVVYATNVAFLKAAKIIKSQFKNVRLNLIIPDLPEDIVNRAFIPQLLNSFRSLFFNTPESYYKYFDSFVLLTDFMKDKIGCQSSQYIVNEGIYEEQVTKRIPHQENAKSFTMFYGGMLHEKFGIMNLVNAVLSIEDPNIRLQLCGYGDCVERVKKIAENDARIQYLGVVSRDEVLNYQSKASLLINPRIPDGNPFTKYSFPSKTLEYLASGTPTLLYQLEGIPAEYYQYCYNLDANHTSHTDLAKKIVEIKSIPVEQRLRMASSARNFVLEEKNQIKAAQQILELLKKTV